MEISTDGVNLLGSPKVMQRVDQINNNRYSRCEYAWLISRGCLNSIAHMLIGANVFVALWFAFKSASINTFELHIGLNVIGYQMLMSHAILSFNQNNGWSSQLSTLHRLRAHVVLQLIGSTLAIAGSVIIMKEKSVNFTSVHGKLALASLIFTTISLMNGTISLFSTGHSNSIKITKINHLICGTAAFTLSSASLSFGYYKNVFKEWASDEIALIMICLTWFYTVIVVMGPCKNVVRKLSNFKIKRS